MKKFLHKLKSVSIWDYAHVVLFVLAIIPSRILKRRRPKMWLVCEYGKEARENGYYFYKYVRENHPEQDIVYAIELDSEDANNVISFGEVVPYGTLKHWIYYLAADINISSHKGGKPNAAVCYFLEIYGFWKNKRVFLQHGITKDRTEIFMYPNTKFRLFVCGAEPEYNFVKETFGYPEGYVCYTGLARFDKLHEPISSKKQILVAPTWRSWLRRAGSDPYKSGANKDIEKSEYYKAWECFLQSSRLADILEKYNFELVFYPHRNVLECFNKIKVDTSRIRIADYHTSDLQRLMRESMIMITDYSSAVMDFAYTYKPVIYYQFDTVEFRRKHLEKGYYDYERDGFGPVCVKQDDLFYEIEKMLSEQCTLSLDYKKKIEKFFTLHDNQNCLRIYKEIKKL